MTDQTMLTPFEQRLAAEFQQMVAGAIDLTPAADIADAAMRPRGIKARARRSRSARRLVLLGLAAVLIVPAAYLGASRLVPPPNNSVLPKPSLLARATPGATSVPTDGPPTPYQAVITRPAADGIAVYVARADGGERLLTTILNSSLPAGDSMSPYAKASLNGYVALEDQVRPWPMVIADIREPGGAPWVVYEASTGGVAPVWGPTNLVAAAPAGSALDFAVVADPQTHIVTHVNRIGVLMGGGPTMFWTADGGMLIEDQADGSLAYSTYHLDGTPETPGFPALADQRNIFGPGGSRLTLCEQGESECPINASEGGVRLLTLDGVSEPVYAPQAGQDRVLSAGFGSGAADYWLLLDHNSGRQVRLAHQSDQNLTYVSTVDRASDWGDVSIGPRAPDDSLLSLNVSRGDQSGVVIVDAATGDSTFHDGWFAGFIETSALGEAAPGEYSRPEPPAASGGEAYRLPSVDELSAAETALNPGHVPTTKLSRDGDPSDHERHSYSYTADESGSDVYLDCYGPAGITVTVSGSIHDYTLQAPCSRAGTYEIAAVVPIRGDIVVDATGDTSWRVVVYTDVPSPGDTPAPVAEPV